MKRRKANWIHYIWPRNCLINYVIEGKIEVIERRRRRLKQLLDGIKETRGYWKLEDEALDRALRSNSFKRGYGCVLVIASKEAMDVS
jgi:hypothetical protein